MSFDLIQLNSYNQLLVWIKMNPDYLSLSKQGKGGYILTIELDVGMQIQIWGGDPDALLDAINFIANKKVTTVIKEVRVKDKNKAPHTIMVKAEIKRVPYIPFANQDYGYIVEFDGAIKTCKKVWVA